MFRNELMDHVPNVEATSPEQSSYEDGLVLVLARLHSFTNTIHFCDEHLEKDTTRGCRENRFQGTLANSLFKAVTQLLASIAMYVKH